MTDQQHFFNLPDGRSASLFTIENGGSCARISDFGGVLVELFVPARGGLCRNIVLGFADPLEYTVPGPNFGILVGRYANRIKGAKFKLDKVEYHLEANQRGNMLHGGFQGFGRRLWEVLEFSSSVLTLRLHSPDGDGGFPGNLMLDVTYSLDCEGALHIEYRAECDRRTVVNFTNHTYFRLDDSPSIDRTVLKVAAFYVTEVDSKNIPTGWMARVLGTPFDLTKGKTFAQIFAELGILDHNFVLEDGVSDQPRFAARAASLDSGISVELWTTEPGVQVYDGYGLNGSNRLRNGEMAGTHCGFCLEAQHFPDSPHHKNFPSTVLSPGETYRQHTIYRFKLNE